MSDKRTRAARTLGKIHEELLKSTTIEEVLSIVNRYGGRIRSTYSVKRGHKILISGEIELRTYYDAYDEHVIGSIIYRAKGSLFCSCHSWDIPHIMLPPEKIELIKGVF